MFVAHTLIQRYKKNGYKTKNIQLIYCDHKTRDHREAEHIEKTFGMESTIHIMYRRKKNKPNNEERLRARRYKSFQKIITKTNAQALILGHNLTDRIETTFLNILR